MAAIIVSNVSSSSAKQDLWKHFRSRKRGGGPIDYLIFPYCNDPTKAFIAFQDTEVLNSVLNHKHKLGRRLLTMELAPKQLSALCRVEVHPTVVDSIEDLDSFVTSLERDIGAWAVDSDDSGRLSLSAPLAQLRNVLSRLDDMRAAAAGRVRSSVTSRLTWHSSAATPGGHCVAFTDLDAIVYMRTFCQDAVQAIEEELGVGFSFVREPGGDGGKVRVCGPVAATRRLTRLYADTRSMLHRYTEPFDTRDCIWDIADVFASCLLITHNAAGRLVVVGRRDCVEAAVQWLRSQRDSALDGVLHATLYWDGERHALASTCCDKARQHVQKMAETSAAAAAAAFVNSVPAKTLPKDTGTDETQGAIVSTSAAAALQGQNHQPPVNVLSTQRSKTLTAVSRASGGQNLVDDTRSLSRTLPTASSSSQQAWQTDTPKDEHKGTPYCHVPCYGALFGPKMFGHGSLIDAHANFGEPSPDKTQECNTELLAKLKAYNAENAGTTLSIKSKEVNSRLVLDGTLRVYWGVHSAIQFKSQDDDIPPSRCRQSYGIAIDNGLDFTKPMTPTSQQGAAPVVRRSNTVQLRSNKPRRRAQRRKSMINGHVYDLETSVFTPVYNTTTSVTISSLDTAPKVIKMLLDKFKVENSPDSFCLCKVMRNGETKILGNCDVPLVERVISGPRDDVAKIFIMERTRVKEVTQEVAQYVNLPMPMLEAFLKKFDDEQCNEEKEIREKYRKLGVALQERLKQLPPSLQT